MKTDREDSICDEERMRTLMMVVARDLCIVYCILCCVYLEVVTGRLSCTKVVNEMRLAE